MSALIEPPEVDDGPAIEVEAPLLFIKECFVYRVPPLRSASGHRAEDWKLADPLFTGACRLVQHGEDCHIRLLKPPPGEGRQNAAELFAECPVRLGEGRTLAQSVESVTDSSRYFVLRCEDRETKRYAYVGVGFRERSSAFDFKATLDDFVRSVERQQRARDMAAAAAAAYSSTAAGGNAQQGYAGAAGGDTDGADGVAAVAAPLRDMS
ncbi:unnamed protein product, partial [Phaeothamnion confervicola]